MQLQLIYEKPGTRLFKRSGFQITNRDVEICKFILEMKFSTAKEIYRRFFQFTLLGTQSTGIRAALKRLMILEKRGLLSAKTYFQSKQKIYFATQKSLKLISALRPASILPYPIKNVDIRTFEHDDLLIKLRGILEGRFGAKDWISEKVLREFPELCSDLEESQIPDAIYVNAEGEKIAFELEISLKSPSNYREKIRRYINYLRSNKTDKAFSKIHFVCTKDIVKKHLDSEARIYQEIFKIEKIENLVPNYTK